MVWQLLLAHFLADYPLQPPSMARSKHRPGVLLLHAGIHLLVMAAVTLPMLAWWPYLLALAAFHFTLDAGKTWLSAHYPRLVAGPYLADQALHLLSILVIGQWGLRDLGRPAAFLSPRVAVILTGLLLVTHVYQVTERVLTGGRTAARSEWGRRAGLRMALRGSLLAVLLLGWSAFPALGGVSLVLALRREDARIWLADLLVTAAAAYWVILTIRGLG